MTDWAVGDRAVCVNDTPNPSLGITGAVAGRVYRVTVVGPTRPHALFGPHPSLWVDGLTPVSPAGFSAARFRKIRPDEHEGNAEDWALLLETAKPKQLEPISTRDGECANNGSPTDK